MDDELWNATRARQKQISEIFGPNPANTLEGRMKRVHLANRPVHLLSGLLTCGCCGGKYGIITPNRYACLNHHRRGTNDNGRSITRQNIEARVLSGLKERLVSSESVAEAVKAYAEEMNRLNRDLRTQVQTDQKALAKIEKAIVGIIAAIEDGMYQPSMKARMDELERQKAEITVRMAQAPADVPDVHPNIANLYRLRVERLTEALSDPDGGRQAAEALRSLIGEIILTPGEKRGEVHAELRGELFGILDFIKAEEAQREPGLILVADARPATKIIEKAPWSPPWGFLRSHAPEARSDCQDRGFALRRFSPSQTHRSGCSCRGSGARVYASRPLVPHVRAISAPLCSALLPAPHA